jgi:hypothetical protein
MTKMHTSYVHTDTSVFVHGCARKSMHAYVGVRTPDVCCVFVHG